MEATYDPAVRAHYVLLTDDEPVAHTVEVAPGVNVDLGYGGVIVGVEVLERGMRPLPQPERLTNYPAI